MNRRFLGTSVLSDVETEKIMGINVGDMPSG